MNGWIKVGIIASSLVGAETGRAQRRVLSTLTNAPPYRIEEGPLVSVVIPAYNEEDYLPSVLIAYANQTYANIEVIVVDNLSEDDTIAIAGSMGAKVISNPDYNLSRSRNMGAAEAKGNIIVFNDADTIPEAMLIEKCVESIQNGAAYVITGKTSSDVLIMGVGRVLRSLLGPEPSGQFIAVSRQALDAVGGFNEDCLPQDQCSEDLDFTERLAAYGPMAYLRWNYVGTSSRRQIAQGFSPLTPHWDQRAYRWEVT